MGPGCCPSLIVRADGDGKIGTGHVMRAIALAQSWRDDGSSVHFVSAHLSEALKTRLSTEGFATTRIDITPGCSDDIRNTIAIATRVSAKWVLLDGYSFGSSYQEAVKDAGLNLLCMDDCEQTGHYFADVVINQNVSASEDNYTSREPHTKLLLGTRYALLRKEFDVWRSWQREIPERAAKVLVTLGGADPDNVTMKVLRALKASEQRGMEALIVVGGANPHYDQLQSEAEGTPVKVVRNAANLPELMAWADLAVCAGGSTLWELALLGLPAAVVILAENQRPNAEGMHKAGAGVNLGWHTELEPPRIAAVLSELALNRKSRERMSDIARRMVDGRGAERVRRIALGVPITLRAVEVGDCRLLWDWANDPVTRAVSFTSDAIPWEDHVKWFQSKQADPDCALCIAENEECEPLGQVRLDFEGDEATISIGVAPSFRGKGCGPMIINAACEMVFESGHVRLVNAYIKPDNAPSIRAFEKAGFALQGTELLRGLPALRYVRYTAAGEGVRV